MAAPMPARRGSRCSAPWARLICTGNKETDPNRVVELFEIIRKELGSLLDEKELRGGILLTGGASQMPGVEQVASKVLGLPVRKAGFPPGIEPELAQPENATVMGLLHYGMHDHNLPGQKRDEAQTGFLGKLASTLGIGG